MDFNPRWFIGAKPADQLCGSAKALSQTDGPNMHSSKLSRPLEQPPERIGMLRLYSARSAFAVALFGFKCVGNCELIV
jgi:hypothetical protein